MLQILNPTRQDAKIGDYYMQKPDGLERRDVIYIDGENVQYKKYNLHETYEEGEKPRRGYTCTLIHMIRWSKTALKRK